MPTEIEIELHAPDKNIFDRLLQDEDISQYIKDDISTHHMLTRYFDTPDFDLLNAGYRLRVREIKGNYIAALKTDNFDDNAAAPAGLTTRHSWQCTVGSSSDAVSRLIAVGAPEEILSIINSKSLVEISKTDFERTSVVLHMPDGLRVEMAMDDGFMTANGKELPINRVELELLFGDVGNLLSFAQSIIDDYGLEHMPQDSFRNILNTAG